MNTIVMVYGTLLQGWGNNRLLENSTFMGDVQTKGTLFDLGSFPAFVERGNTDVRGELYSVDEATLASLDRLEGHPNFYERRIVETNKGPAWIYTMDNAEARGAPVIKSGNWNLKKEVA